MLKKITFIGLSLLIAGGAIAGPSEVRSKLGEKYPMFEKNLPIRAVEGTNLYEINLYGTPAYTDENVSYLFAGGMMLNKKDGKLNNLTITRKEALALESFRKLLPMDMALKRVYGKGERKLVTFEDPDCPVCKKQTLLMARGGESLNVTVYTFMMPLSGIHPEAEAKARKILCAPNPSKAWEEWMMFERLPENSPSSCQAAEDHLKKIDRVSMAMALNSTPTMVFEHGEVWKNGLLTNDKMEKGLFYATSRIKEIEESLSKLDSSNQKSNDESKGKKPKK